MGGNIVFAYHNRLDLADIGADNQVPTLPAANVQSKQRREVWRTTDTGGADGHYLIAPFAADEFAEGFFMTNHNFTTAGTYRIRAGSAAITGGAVTVAGGSAAVTKSGGPAWPARLAGGDLVYGAGTNRKAARIAAVTGADALTLAAPAAASYAGADYMLLDFAHAYHPVNYPEGFEFDTGVVETWKSLWGAGEDRAGFHGAGGLPEDVDLDYIRPIEMLLFDAPQEHRYWKIHFYDAVNGDGFMEAGRLFLGPLFRPSRNFSADFNVHPFSDPSGKEDSMGQVTHSDEKQKYSQMQLNFEGIEPSEAQSGFAQLQNVVGLTRDFFVCLEPDQKYSNWFYSTFYGRLSREIALRTSRINKRLRDVELFFRESL